MIVHHSLKIIQNAVYARKPEPITKMYKVGNRASAPIFTKIVPRSKMLSNFFPYKYTKSYNSIPDSLKLVTDRKFKQNLKKGKIAVIND